MPIIGVGFSALYIELQKRASSLVDARYKGIAALHALHIESTRRSGFSKLFGVSHASVSVASESTRQERRCF